MNEYELTRRDFLRKTSGAVILSLSAGCEMIPKGSTQNSDKLPPVRAITKGPKFHWFSYYDKLEFDPSGRYVLGMEVDFEHRNPKPNEAIKIGMVDLKMNDKWIELGESKAWCWQQGCMLQWRPGSKNEILWNDIEGKRFVCRILNIKTGKKRTIPHPIYSLSPDGSIAVSTDFSRVNDMRRGYGYVGLPDSNKDKLAPENSGIYRVDIETGQQDLIVSLAQIAEIQFPLDDLSEKKHYFNHLLVNPDGTRFAFLHRWLPAGPSDCRTRMLTANMDGSDVRVINQSGCVSHFIWRDPEHILAWSWYDSPTGSFCLFEDMEGGKIEPIGKGYLPTDDGHCMYLPGNKWMLFDTYPDEHRKQTPYLYNISNNKIYPLGHFYLPPEYNRELRIDTHPRFSPDGRSVVIDSAHEGKGRQMYLIDITAIVR